MTDYNSLHEIAETAVAIQDASNYRAVSLELSKAVKWMSDDAVRGGEKRECSDEFRRDLTKMFTYKLMQLAFNREPMEYGQEFTEAYRKVKVYLMTFEGFKSPDEFAQFYPRLKVRNWEYLSKVLEFAKSRGLLGKLMEKLSYLNNYAGDRSKGCELTKDFSPNSFEFCMLDQHGNRWFNGGLIYYGRGETGSTMPQLSVRIGDDLKEGWEVNT